MEVILASASPRRREILKNAGIDFRVVAADIDESTEKTAPHEVVLDISKRKAEAVAKKTDGIVIAADTVVALDGEILGKPKDDEDAFRMLRALSGREHEVYTGVCVIRGDRCDSFYEKTKVFFRDMTDDIIKAYIETGEPRDKAGAYAIQGKCAAYITRIEGDYLNVVGLPLSRLCQLLEGNGYLHEFF